MKVLQYNVKIRGENMEFKEAFGKKFRLQQIGAILLIVAIVLLLKQMAIPCYIVLGAVLVLDLYLSIRDKKKGDVLTITQWFRPLFPKKIDMIITIALAGVFIYVNPFFGLFFLMGTIHGHLNGDW